MLIEQFSGSSASSASFKGDFLQQKRWHQNLTDLNNAKSLLRNAKFVLFSQDHVVILEKYVPQSRDHDIVLNHEDMQIVRFSVILWMLKYDRRYAIRLKLLSNYAKIYLFCQWRLKTDGLKAAVGHLRLIRSKSKGFTNAEALQFHSLRAILTKFTRVAQRHHLWPRILKWTVFWCHSKWKVKVQNCQYLSKELHQPKMGIRRHKALHKSIIASLRSFFAASLSRIFS